MFEILNCLVLDTPNTFWNDKLQTDELQRRIDNGPYTWLGSGDWVCSPKILGLFSIGTYVPNASACLKHDLAFSSLPKFVGGVKDDNILDEAWNPRNRALADALLGIDLICKHRVIVQNTVECRSELPDGRTILWAVLITQAQEIIWSAVEGVPVTTYDIEHASARPEYIACTPPYSCIRSNSTRNRIL